MLTINGREKRVCSGLSRRDLIRAGGLGLFGLNVPQLLAAEDASRQLQATHGFTPGAPFPKGRAKSVLFLYLFGGPSQLETFDMKPEASDQLRGPFQPIDSRTPGLRICEHLHRTAAMSDRFAVIRSMTHKHNDHNACHYLQTGHTWTRSAESGSDVNARPTDWPSMGSAIEFISQHSADAGSRAFPDYVYLPNRLGHLQGYDRTGQYAGWLGNAYNALATDIRRRDSKDNPFFRECTEEELDFRIKGLVSRKEVSLDRLDRRRSLLEQFDETRRTIDQTRSFDGYSGLQQRALDLVTSDNIRSALDIQKEKPALRDQYGRHLFGQSVLMGRRMIEAGCRFVSVIWDAPDGYSWDSHVHSNDLRDHLIPKFDQSYSALLTDMEDRGLLDETLVVVVGEMGRTPKPTATWGRGHWSHCFPCLLAGAGVKGGITYGKSDRDAAYPIEKPVSPEDLAATIYSSLGVSHELQLPNAQGRPVTMIEGGQPLDQLFG